MIAWWRFDTFQKNKNIVCLFFVKKYYIYKIEIEHLKQNGQQTDDFQMQADSEGKEKKY